MSKSSNPADRRQFGRRQTSLHAWISVPGRPRLPCIVKDISVGGALLLVDCPSWLPFTFHLTIEGARFANMCEVRHSSSNSVGVRFMAEAAVSEVDRLGSTDNRSLDGVDAWAGEAGSVTTPQARVNHDGNAVARAMRQRL